MRQLIIDRDKWLRGGSGFSRLRRFSDGKMCCLGFEALRRGFSEKDIEGLARPMDVALSTNPTIWRDLVNERGMDTDLCMTLMAINDAETMFDDEREDNLKKDFLQLGVEVLFIGDNKNNILELETFDSNVIDYIGLTPEEYRFCITNTEG